MEALLLHPTSTAQWHALVAEAQSKTTRHLDEELESYLIFLLMRFTSKPEMATSIMALQYLQGIFEIGRLRQERLRDVGDQCLLYSGLFPQRAQRRRVEISYFVDIGRSAYRELSNCSIKSASEMYAHLSDGFVALMDVLQSMRDLGTQQARLSPLDAFSLWRDTGSQHAEQTLRRYSKGTLVMTDTDDEMH